MPKLKLTRTSIEKVAKPGPSDVLYWDTETRGLGLRVTKAGVCSFIAQGRVRGTTKDRRLTIGTYGAWQIEDARRRAEDYRRLFEDGIDPNDLKKQYEAEQVTLGTVAREYLSRPDKLKPSTVKWINYYVDRVFADWKDKPVTAITRDMVRERHREVAERGVPGKKTPKGAPSSANSAMVNLRALLNFAAQQERSCPNQTQQHPALVRSPNTD